MDKAEELMEVARKRDLIAAQRDRELDREPVSKLVTDAQRSFANQLEAADVAGDIIMLEADKDVIFSAFSNSVTGLITEVQLEREYTERVEELLRNVLATTLVTADGGEVALAAARAIFSEHSITDFCNQERETEDNEE